ncbi:MAG: Sec-independent protein translocase protein TatB [Thiobacillus sp.]|nr:Sec-independent protein translocase protein TatB [Thiobacillus sp.]
MFDIGFSELVVIGIVALIVIGPERLPKVARTAGHLYGRLQRYVSTVKSDISQEIQLDEIRRAGQTFKESIESAASDVGQQATVVDDYLRNELDNVNKLAATTVSEGGEPTLKPALAEVPAQQSLPLDAPDQNAGTLMPSAVVETAHGENAKNPA